MVHCIVNSHEASDVVLGEIVVEEGEGAQMESQIPASRFTFMAAPPQPPPGPPFFPPLRGTSSPLPKKKHYHFLTLCYCM